MKRANALLSATLLAFAIVACQQVSENTAAPDDANLAATADVETLPPDEEAGATLNESNAAINEAEDSGSEEPTQTVIPAQYRGRWGLVAADCTSTRGDAKGLMTVGDTSIRFYESSASLQEQRPAIATSFAGVFVFNGEGQTWERVVTLTRTGDRLKRAQADGTFNYRRCD
jgi:hypothetical protein